MIDILMRQRCVTQTPYTLHPNTQPTTLHPTTQGVGCAGYTAPLHVHTRLLWDDYN